MRCQKLGGKAGEKLVGIAAVNEEDDLILIASDGKLVRVHANQISLVSRGSSGIFVMRPEEGEKLISFQRVKDEKEIEESAESAVESDEVLTDEEVPDLETDESMEEEDAGDDEDAKEDGSDAPDTQG
jgi:DNA gyrase/topoisomerase IV subunit A